MLLHLREREPRLHGDHLLQRLVAVLPEAVVELRDRLSPVELSLLDLVELLLHPGRVLGLEEVVEALLHQVDDEAPEKRGEEAAVLLPNVLAILDLPDDLGVGRGAADAVLLEELHERGLVEPRRGLRLVVLDRRLRRAGGRSPPRAAGGGPSPRRRRRFRFRPLRPPPPRRPGRRREASPRPSGRSRWRGRRPCRDSRPAPPRSRRSSRRRRTASSARRRSGSRSAGRASARRPRRRPRPPRAAGPSSSGGSPRGRPGRPSSA